MAIADIANPTAAKKGPPCGVCATLGNLPDDEATALRALLADKGWRYTELSDRLRDKADIDLPAFVLSRHARGQCGARDRLR